MAVYTDSYTMDDLIRIHEEALATLTVPDEGPGPNRSKDGLELFGNAQTYQHGAFRVVVSATDTGEAGGSWGYTYERAVIRIENTQDVLGNDKANAHRRMARLQHAIKAKLLGWSDLQPLPLYRLQAMPEPSKEGRDYYKAEVIMTAEYYTPAHGRSC